MMNPEMRQYLGLFLDEASEQISALEQATLGLERGGSWEILQEMFRAAHTLKGSARAMGFSGIADLTHALEDVLDSLRAELLEFAPAVVQGLFEAIDLLRTLHGEVTSGGEEQSPAAEVAARLRHLLHAGECLGLPQPPVALSAEEPVHAANTARSDEPAAAQSAPTAECTAEAAGSANIASVAAEAAATGLSIYQVEVELAADCEMKSIRAFMVLQSMEAVGSVLATVPDEGALQAEEFERTFTVTLATAETVEEVRATALQTSEISEVRVSPWSPKSEAAPEAAPEAVPAAELSQAVHPVVAAAAPVAQEAAQTPEQPAYQGPERRKQPRTPDERRSQTVRVDVARLDNLLNLVGELVIDQTRIAACAGRLQIENGADRTVDQLAEASAHFGRIATDLQNEIMKARMLPLETVFSRFPRMVRDLARDLNKELEFLVTGQETEIDRSVIEVIADPLSHILRNCVDHGIEEPEARAAAGKKPKGSVWLRARHAENYIIVEIEDDGKGIDPATLRAKAVRLGILTPESATRLSDRDAIQLVFAPGFSTAEEVTAVSGRGVGMDIVRNNLSKFGALLDIDSVIGRGTVITIRVPLTLAIIRGLLVRAAESTYAVPLASVVETIRVPAARIRTVGGNEAVVHRGATLPLVRLKDVFGAAIVQPRDRESLRSASHNGQHTGEKLEYVVVAGLAEQRVGLVVDSLTGEQEIVIKPLGKLLNDVRGFSGAAILGDGQIALILDVNGLIQIAREEKVGAYAA